MINYHCTGDIPDSYYRCGDRMEAAVFLSLKGSVRVRKISVNTSTPYEVLIERGSLAGAGRLIAGVTASRKAVVITDDTVGGQPGMFGDAVAHPAKRLYLAGLEIFFHEPPAFCRARFPEQSCHCLQVHSVGCPEACQDIFVIFFRVCQRLCLEPRFIACLHTLDIAVVRCDVPPARLSLV